MRGLVPQLAPFEPDRSLRHPGLIKTPLTEGIPEDMITIPLGRAGRPEEVASFVLFLASDESSYATGTEFIMDGGTVQGVPHKS